MKLRPRDPNAIPVLTDVVDDAAEPAFDVEAAAARVSAQSIALAERLIQRALEDAQADLRQRVLAALRNELPDVVARALREQLADSNEVAEPPPSDG